MSKIISILTVGALLFSLHAKLCYIPVSFFYNFSVLLLFLTQLCLVTGLYRLVFVAVCGYRIYDSLVVFDII